MKALTMWLVLVGLAGPAWAQDPPPPPPPPPADAQAIDATKLGVDLSRIQRGLRVAESREKFTTDGLRLNYSIQVYGQAPKIDVLQGIDLFNGGVPGSAPSHNQMIEFWTPAIYRSPTMPVSALAFWAAQQIWQKSKKSQCEEEIATYRSLVMQGVNVSAPRCTQ
jgi:hypothetical protein